VGKVRGFSWCVVASPPAPGPVRGPEAAPWHRPPGRSPGWRWQRVAPHGASSTTAQSPFLASICCCCWGTLGSARGWSGAVLPPGPSTPAPSPCDQRGRADIGGAQCASILPGPPQGPGSAGSGGEGVPVCPTGHAAGRALLCQKGAKSCSDRASSGVSQGTGHRSSSRSLGRAVVLPRTGPTARGAMIPPRCCGLGGLHGGCSVWRWGSMAGSRPMLEQHPRV